MKKPRWIDRDALVLLHAQTIAEHGGSGGVRDEGLLESALARPQNLHAYENVIDLVPLAAAYAMGLACNHAFIDGNKRVSFLSIGLFLGLNGQSLKADKADATRMMFAVAAGEADEKQLADWIRANLK